VIKSFDFLRFAWSKEAFKKTIIDYVKNGDTSVLETDSSKLVFDGVKQTLFILPSSDAVLWDGKFVPKGIKYSALIHLLNKDFEKVALDDIFDV